MSVSVEPSRHFSQQPSPPPFSSTPQSPNHLLHAQMPASPPPLPPPPADVDMSSSTITLAPAGQQHDREDEDMADGGGLTGSEIRQPLVASSDREAAHTVAIEVAPVDDDVMDTTPDAETGLVPSSNSAVPPDAAVTPTSPPASETVTGDQPSNGELLLPVAAPDEVVSVKADPRPHTHTKSAYSHM
jgi:hypothetical protein